MKGTATLFAGLASLPVIRDALVLHYHLLSDQQLNDAVVITRSTPGPVGLYVVSVGYSAMGIPGAVAGWLAMSTPALLVIPLVRFVGKRYDHPRVRSLPRAVVLAGAGLLLAAAVPLGKEALTEPVSIAVVALVFLVTSKVEVVWIVLGAAAVSAVATAAGIVTR